jgi:hypothetical protein
MPFFEQPRFFIVNAVWGPEYIDVFTRISIPALLGSDNLPALPNLASSEFLIYTTERDEAEIRADPIYRELERLVQVVFLPLEVTTEHKYDLMKRAHSSAIRRARAASGYCIFLAPDALLSNGMLMHLYELCSAGRRVVAGFGPRLNQEDAIDELLRHPEYSKGVPFALAPREMVSFAMRHLHRDFLAHFIDSPSFPQKPYCCAWHGPDHDGMLVRAFGLHPYLFDARLVPEDGDLDNATIDHNLIPRFVGDLNAYYVETDSDHFSIYGLTPGTVRAKPEAPARIDGEQLSLWLLRGQYQFMNRAGFAYPIRFHARSMDQAWDELVRRTQEFALDVIDPSRSLLDWTRVGVAVSRSLAAGSSSSPKEVQSLVHEVGSIPVGSAARIGQSDDLAQIPFFYTIAIWGERYVDYFARWAIPSLLAPNNLPALPNLTISKFLIATTAEDEKRIRAKAEFRMLERFVEVEFAHFPAMAKQSDKYAGLRIGHSWGARRATGKGFALFLGPDAIYPDGMLATLYNHAAAGKEVVVGMGPRVTEETISEELAQKGRIGNVEPLIVAPREAAALLMRHMHEDVRRLRWTSPFFAPTPYMCVWDVGGGDGMLIRPFSLHPYLVDYRLMGGGRGSPETGAVIDGTFTADCLFTWDKIHQVTDSDEFVVLSITPAGAADFTGRQVNPDPFVTLARWAQRTDITMLHRLYFMQALKIHVGDLDERWRQLEQETLELSYQIFSTVFRDHLPTSEIYTPVGAAVARYSERLNGVFDELFIERFSAAFEAHFAHHFPDRFDKAFVERFALPFEVHFDKSFPELFGRSFPELFGRAFSGAFDTAFSAELRERLSARRVVGGMARRLGRRLRRR